MLLTFLYGEYFNATTPPAAQEVPFAAQLDSGGTDKQVELAMIDSTPYKTTPPEPTAGAVGKALYAR